MIPNWQDTCLGWKALYNQKWWFWTIFGSPKGRGHTKPTTGEFKVFLDFIVFIFWYTITMGIEYDYKGGLNMTKLSEIDRIHVLVESII